MVHGSENEIVETMIKHPGLNRKIMSLIPVILHILKNTINILLYCTAFRSSYTKPGARSNMAVAEVDALSGYRFDGDQLGSLMDIGDLQRAELDKDDTRMNLYFNPVYNFLVFCNFSQ